MTKEIDDLIALQKLDIRLTVLSDFLAALPATREALAAERQAAEDVVKAKHTELDQAKESLRRAERHLAEHEDKLKQTTAKLNMVKTNKEYDASLREIEEWKKRIGETEEEIILLYDKVEAAEGQRAALDKEWKFRAAEFDARKTELEGKAKSAQAEFDVKSGQRPGLAELVTADSLKVYERVRGALGRALVRADKEVCHGCWAIMPAQIYNEVLKGDQVIRCQNCQRIMVHAEAELEEGLTEITA